MTARYFCPHPDQPIPRDVIVELWCDGHSMLCINQAFPCNDFFGFWKTANAAGWSGVSGERQLGPCCSGKAVA